MPPLRFRLRTLLIAVAIAGTLLGGVITLWRFEETQRRAHRYAYRAMTHLGAAERWLEEAEASETEAQASHARAMAAYHAALRRKYEQGISNPWKPVPPDPPPPE